jgi:hypothetical protein
MKTPYVQYKKSILTFTYNNEKELQYLKKAWEEAVRTNNKRTKKEWAIVAYTICNNYREV